MDERRLRKLHHHALGESMTTTVRSILTAFLVLILATEFQTARAQDTSDKPLATMPGEVTGIHIDVLSLKRDQDGMLTLRVAFVNDSGGPVKNTAFPGVNGSGWRPALIDYKSKQKYGIIEFTDGSCLCTTNLIASADFAPGRKVLWAKFRAPPTSVRTIALLAGTEEPLEGLPITQ